LKRIPKILIFSLENLYLVGGAVRDLILGLEPKEYDLITTTPLERIRLKTFAESNNGQTIGFFSKGVKYDISHYSSLIEDLERRDFTINSMALPVKKNGTISLKEIVDPCGGLDDLKAGLLRSFNPLDSFFSDPVRVVRGLRFISEYDLNVEQNTLDAMKGALKEIDKVARERIFSPLSKFIEGKYFQKAAKVAVKIGLDKLLFVPLENIDAIEILDPCCRWPAIFWEKMDVFSKFINVVFPPKHLIRWITRLTIFSEEVKHRKFGWTVRISKEESNCLLSLLKVFKLNSDIVEKYARLDLAVTPQELIFIGAKGREISIIMTEIWKSVLTSKLPNEKNHLLNFAREILKNLH